MTNGKGTAIGSNAVRITRKPDLEMKKLIDQTIREKGGGDSKKVTLLDLAKTVVEEETAKSSEVKE